MLYCYHHTDMDGKMAAHVVHMYKPNMIEDSPSGYIPTNYGDNFDKHTVKDDVVIVDISISESDYSKLINVCKTARSVIWIDHHITSLNTVSNHKEELQRISNLTYFVSTCACGAALAYAFLHIPQENLMNIRNTTDDEYYSIDAEYENGAIAIIISKRKSNNSAGGYKWYDYKFTLPRWLYYVDDFDCWKNLDPNSNFVKLAFDAYDTRYIIPNDHSSTGLGFNPFYNNIVYNPNRIPQLIQSGRIINEYIHAIYTSQLGECFEWFNGETKFLCKNGSGNSWEFGHKIKEYDAVILFNYSGKSGMWKYSVYSDDSSSFDCAKFAEKYDGGGHIHASGFSTKYLIFTTNKPQGTQKTTKLSNTIFLGGTVSDDYDWRYRFIKLWNNSYVGEEKIELFNPVVDKWTEEARKKEQEVKSTARINLFVVTPEQNGAFTFVEAIESAMSYRCKTMLLVCDNETTGDKVSASVDAIGERVKAHGGIFKRYKSLQSLVNDVIDAL